MHVAEIEDWWVCEEGPVFEVGFKYDDYVVCLVGKGMVGWMGVRVGWEVWH